MDFEDFEGFKRIKNEKDLKIEDIFKLLENYKTEIGQLKLEDSNIIADVNGKYYIKVSIHGKQIILERHLEQGHIKDDELMVDSAIELSQTDRMIDQIYDLLNDYIKNDIVTEHITSSKKVLYMREEFKKIAGDLLTIGKLFKVEDEQGKVICEVHEKILMNEFVLKNCLTKREEWSLKYPNYKQDRYTILKQPFERIDISRNTNEVKNIFEGNIKKSKLKIAADYSDNHYLIELDEIVIGSIDCMDPLIKKEYRIEVNDLSQEYLIIAIAVLVDTFALKQYMESNKSMMDY